MTSPRWKHEVFAAVVLLLVGVLLARPTWAQDEQDDPYRDAKPAEEVYFDLDLYQRMQDLDARFSRDDPDSLSDFVMSGRGAEFWGIPDEWQWQWLPDGLIYSPPMAGPKESRFSLNVIYEQDDGWLYDANLGATTGLVRYGSWGTQNPVGFQMDLEGSAQMRIDLPESLDVRSADYRVGVPLTFGRGRWRTRVGYYHISSHLADEFLLKNPTFSRLNYVRDVVHIGHTIYLTSCWRIYADAGWAFRSDVAKEWEFQFGTEYLGGDPWLFVGGVPFWALNGQLREELDFGGGVTAQAGWAWTAPNGRRLRVGLHYFNGHSNQWSFFRQHEQQLGVGLWLDR
ncbi:MAG TPA: DUF1207 domain-containing protein [Planctomycetaceae bacterium]|nr:DUF1207 domain-containing protein [Planctomycetaceae bacterium]